jgi:hypothetical protein
MADLIPELLRAEARFALKTTEELSALPHSEAMPVPIGGLPRTVGRPRPSGLGSQTRRLG